MIVSFPTALGHSYRLEHSENLTSTAWITLADNLAGTGAPRSVAHMGALALPQRFYRVLLLQ